MNQPKSLKRVLASVQFAIVWSAINIATILPLFWQIKHPITGIFILIIVTSCSELVWLIEDYNGVKSYFKIHGFASLLVAALILLGLGFNLIYWLLRLVIPALKENRNEAKMRAKLMALQAPLESLEKALAEQSRQQNYRAPGASDVAEAFAALKDAYTKALSE